MYRVIGHIALAACCVFAAHGANESNVELFMVWGLQGRFDGRLEIEGGRFARIEPFSFEPQYGDDFTTADATRAVWRSGVTNQFDGLRVFAEAGPQTTFKLTLPDGARTLRLEDFMDECERTIALKDETRFVVIGRGDPNLGPRCPASDLPMPSEFVAPTPVEPVALPDDWWQAADDRGTPRVVEVSLSRDPGSTLTARRVSRNDGRLYLEIARTDGRAINGEAEVSFGGGKLGARKLSGALWLSLAPRIGRVPIRVRWQAADGAAGDFGLAPPASLVETRGPQLLLNGEPYLVKGTLPRGLTDADAAWLKELGANTLRTRPGVPQVERYGFMVLGVCHSGPGKICQRPYSREEFLAQADEYLANLRPLAAQWVDSPYLLLAQLGNEQAMASDEWTARYGSNPFGRLDYLLARCHAEVKALCPMAVCSYSNHSLQYRAPAFMEAYAHNTYLSTDRGEYSPPVEEFAKRQGCDRRPFVMSEWGANIYMPQAWLFGPNLPVLEKIHAWNYPNRWRTYLAAGVIGGTNYCLYDYDVASARKQVGAEFGDQGFSNFGAMTFDHQPKLAMWESWHLWRDFEIEPAEGGLRLRYARDYWARDCRLALSAGETTETLALGDFAPGEERVVKTGAMDGSGSFHWRIEYSTHGGLPMVATGAHPRTVEAEDFMQRLKGRDTYPFLLELFDAEVCGADGRADATTLAELEREDGVTAVAFRKPNGVVYLTVFQRRKPKQGWMWDGVTVDVAFRGMVTEVDAMTGAPLERPVKVESTASGQRLKGLRAPYLPKRYTTRSPEKLDFPVYRIAPDGR